jgi:hypothetical protein
MIEPDGSEEREAFEAAVTSRLRRPLVRLRADWGRDGDYAHPVSDLSDWVEEIEVERSRTSELPAEVGLIDGYTSAEATATLKGRDRDGRHAVDELSPWNEAAELYGTPMVTADLQVDLGLATAAGPVLLRQFTGPIRSVTADYQKRTVEVSALDPAENLRAIVTLPAGSMTRATYELQRRRYPWTTNSQWALDYVLRRNGVYASPPPPSTGEVIFAATLHGSHVAETAAQTFAPRSGRLLPSYSGSYYRVEHEDGGAHPHGMLAPMGVYDPDRSPSCQYISMGQLYLSGQGSGFGVSILAVLGETSEDLGGNADERIMLVLPQDDGDTYWWELRARADGGIALLLIAGGSTERTWSLDGQTLGERGWQHASWHVEFTASNQCTVRLQVRDQIYTWGDQSVTPMPLTGLRAATRVSLYQPIPLTNAYVWLAAEPPSGGAWPNADHESEADLDVGLNELTSLPEVQAAESWTLLQEITAAEYGLFGFDEDGRPYFVSRETLADTTGDPVRELRTTASIKELASEVNADTIRNSIVWRAQPAWLDSNLDTVVQAEEQREFQVIPGVTVFEIPLDSNVVLGDGVNTVPHWDAEFWDENESDIIHGFAAQRNAGGADVDAYADPPLMELYWERTGPQVGRLTVINNANERVNLACAENDEPALKLGGQVIKPGVETVGEVARPGSIAIHGQRGFEMDESPWRQLIPPQTRVAGSLIATLANAVPVIEDVPVVGDPRLEIGDPVRITDRDQLTVRATVARTNHGASRSDGLYSTVSVRPLAPPGFGILDDDRRGLLDDTMILAP